MAYGRNYNDYGSNRGNWSGGGNGNWNNRRNSYGGGNSRGNWGAAPPPKKSGYSVTMKDDKDLGKVPVCSGWRKTRFGLQRLYARPYKNSKTWKGAKGDEHMNLFVTLTTDGMPEIKTVGTFHFKTNTITIDSQNLVGSPNGGGRTRSGRNVRGYFGRIK